MIVCCTGLSSQTRATAWMRKGERCNNDISFRPSTQTSISFHFIDCLYVGLSVKSLIPSSLPLSGASFGEYKEAGYIWSFPTTHLIIKVLLIWSVLSSNFLKLLPEMGHHSVTSEIFQLDCFFEQNMTARDKQTCNWVPPPFLQRLGPLYPQAWRPFPIWICCIE